VSDHVDVVPPSSAERLVLTAAHELTNPIAALILGLSTLAREDGLSEGDRRDIVSALGRQARHLAALVTDVLGVADVGTAPPRELEPVSLTHVVATALEATVTGPEALTTISVEGTVMAEPVGLVRVVSNLLTNAYRYGGSNVVVSSSAELQRIALTIADDGIGVPEPLLPHLFDRFTRGPNTNGHRGLGIGLRLSRDLIESFGGTLVYEPGEPVGSRFTFNLRAASTNGA
jgi:signal transduction histidine kinase